MLQTLSLPLSELVLCFSSRYAEDYERKGDMPNAIRYYELSLEAARTAEDKKAEALATYRLGEACYKAGRPLPGATTDSLPSLQSGTHDSLRHLSCGGRHSAMSHTSAINCPCCLPLPRSCAFFSLPARLAVAVAVCR